MKASRQILLFSFTLVGFWVLAPALSALLELVSPDNVFLSQLLFYLSRLLTAIPPFFMLGVAVDALCVRKLRTLLAHSSHGASQQSAQQCDIPSFPYSRIRCFYAGQTGGQKSPSPLTRRWQCPRFGAMRLGIHSLSFDI